MRIKVLDHGYLEPIESWGSDERIVEAARMSTAKGFVGWGPRHKEGCYNYPGTRTTSNCGCNEPGDEKLLRYLYENKHETPFEFAGLVIEVQAPIMVFREWHRHRTQCLSPDTMIHFELPARSKNGKHVVHKQRIEDLWRKWQPTVRRERQDRQTNPYFPRSRIQGMKLRCFDEKASEITHTNICDVIRGEPKPMVRVTVASGREITATLEHMFFTDNGWQTLGTAIEVGLCLVLEGTTRGRASCWDVPPVDTVKERWLSIVGWEDIYEISNYGRVRRQGCEPKKTTVGKQGYPVVSLNRPGVQVLRTVHTLVLEAWIGVKQHGQEARHKNHNRLDCRLDNLEWGSSADNSLDMLQVDRQQRLVPVYEEIVSVKDAGSLPTYDLAVNEPWHNFIADGFVVHNSYNEMSARYTPLPDVNYLPTPDRCLMVGGKNKQAGKVSDANELTHEGVLEWLEELSQVYVHAEAVYQNGLKRGIPKELARLPVPVGRYSRMRASTCLRNWLAFLTLRSAPTAQWEIRQYADEVGRLIAVRFPRTWELFERGR